MPPRAFWTSIGLTMPSRYPRCDRSMRRYGRGVDAATIVGLLADPARLKVVAALALGAGTIEEVAQAAGLPLKDVALAARRLARAGLVHRDGHALALHTERSGTGAAVRRPGGGRRSVGLRPRRPARVHPRTAQQAVGRPAAPRAHLRGR